jgi:phage-related tail protein
LSGRLHANLCAKLRAKLNPKLRATLRATLHAKMRAKLRAAAFPIATTAERELLASGAAMAVGERGHEPGAEKPGVGLLAQERVRKRLPRWRSR